MAGFQNECDPLTLPNTQFLDHRQDFLKELENYLKRDTDGGSRTYGGLSPALEL